MAQINEYTPQVETPGPTNGATPNMEYAGVLGRSLQNFGENVSNVGNTIVRRQAQEETSDVYAAIADQRSYWTNRIQQQTRDGTLNVDQLSDDYDNSTGALGENLETPQGKNYFERQQARLKGNILQMANSGQAQIAERKAKGQWQQTINQNSLVLQNDPAQFKDIHDGMLEQVDSLVETGGLPDKFKQQAIDEANAQYAEATLLGHAQVHGAEAARVMMNDGGLGQYLTVEQREKVLGHIDQIDRSKDIEDQRTHRAVKDAQDAVSEKWGQDNLQKLTNNALTTKDVLSAVQGGTLKWEQGERWLNLIKAGAAQDVKDDPRLKNSLINRIADPNNANPITTRDQLMPYVGKGLSVNSFTQLDKLIDKTPDGQALKTGEANLHKAINTVKFKDQMSGGEDLLGVNQANAAWQDYVTQKNKKQTFQEKLDMLNPNSPSYFGSEQNLRKYQTGQMEQMQHQMNQRVQKANGGPTDKNPTPPAKQLAPEAKRENETALQNLFRNPPPELSNALKKAK